MSRQRFFALAIAALIAMTGALYLSTQRNPPQDPRGAALLPSLAGQLNAVTVMTLRRASGTPTATIHEREGRWTVAERAEYPADVAKLRKLLMSLSDARIVEEKTSNPAYFPVIGVEDPSAPGSTGAEVTVTARGERHAVIVGKPMGAGNFVRRNGENKSYSVEPGISFETDPRFWIEPKLISIAATDIQSIQIKPAAGPAYTVRRDSGGAASAPGVPGPGYTLEGVPPGRKAADSASLAPSPGTYGELTAEDVTPLNAVDFSKATAAILTMSDGATITMSGTAAGDKHWISLQTSKDATLNARVAGRAFEVASYRFDDIFRPLERLLVPKPPTGANKPVPAPTP